MAYCTIQDFLSKLYNVGTLKPFTIPWLTINGLLKSIKTKAKLYKKILNYSHCIINYLIAEVFIMRSNSPVSAYAYRDVDALRA